jgi:hypothetical protein
LQFQWKKSCVNLAAWLITEVFLNLTGLDQVATYSEFIFAAEVKVNSRYCAEIAMTIPWNCPCIFQANYAVKKICDRLRSKLALKLICGRDVSVPNIMSGGISSVY